MPPAVKRAYPLAIEEPAENPEDLASSWTPPEASQDLRTLVQETIQGMVPSTASLSADSEQSADLLSNSDYDAEGQLKLGFESDKEYSEGEALQILAYHTGRAQVRRDLLQDKTNRGYRPPPEVREQRRPRDRGPRSDKSPPELLARTRCWNCQQLGHVSRDCKKPPTGGQIVPAKTGTKGFFKPRPSSRFQSRSRGQPALKDSRGSPGRDKSSKPRFFYSAGGQEIQLWMIMSHYASQFIGLSVKAGDSIVDTAAEDGCVGLTQLPKITQSLKPFGLRWVWASTPEDEALSCKGIGGGAVSAGAIEVPAGIAGLCGS